MTKLFQGMKSFLVFEGVTKLAVSPLISSPIQMYKNGGLDERNLPEGIFCHLNPEFRQLLPEKNTMWS
jgi:hypothetical protein